MKDSIVAISLLFTSITASAERPNFTFILSDDIAQGELGVYGQKLIQTPTLDRLANEGTRYNQAYAGTSICAPCRSVFFTGLHSGHCLVRGTSDGSPKANTPSTPKS